MAIDATATYITSVGIGGNHIFRYTHATINASTNVVDIALGVPRKGNFLGMKVNCPTSVQFTLSLAQKDGLSGVGNDIIIPTCSNQNVQYNVIQTLPIPYFNNEVVPASRLLLTINNTDAGHATGTITIDLLVNLPEK